ncbi:hypothetical protein C0992_008546 [Termitomyces sp. T32_za158]|nr:hypothetical protein C0992_008546 [Termitomyces sp. T32_za158]
MRRPSRAAAATDGDRDRDLLELKEIQRSLPRAQQLPDPISGKPPSYLLDHVPIGLLPLLPAPSPARKSPAHPPTTCPALPPAPRPRQPPAPSTAWVPPHMQHLVPTRAPPQPHRPAFAFLPLLDARTRSPSPDHDADADHDPPTPSLTNASLDSSPLSRASDSDSSSPEPPFLALEPPTTAWHPFPSTPKPRPPPRAPPPRRRNVMILNGIEVPIDDDDYDEPVVQSSCAMDLHCFAADIPSPWAG